MGVSDRNGAHCSYYAVLYIQGGHGTWEFISLEQQKEPAHACSGTWGSQEGVRTNQA